MAGKAPARVSTSDLDRELHLPRPFMRKTFQILQKAGYLTSLKGKNGGFILQASADKIRLVDLIALFQGPVSMGDCLFKKKLCECVRTCPLRREIKQIETMALSHLRGVTIASLMKG